MSVFIFSFFLFFSKPSSAAEPRLSELVLPSDYTIEVYARVENARSLALAPDGTVFVGTRSGGSVYALAPDRDGDGRSDKVITLATRLNMPNGVAFKDSDLYVAEVNRIRVFRGVLQKLDKPGPGELWGPEFPSDKSHGWKFVAFGPDGWLYVPVGAPCNICHENPDLYAAIHRISPDGKTRELVARGVRNTVGFDWEPQTGQMWFTDNGRDWMGDDKPPCELNRVSQIGEHFGYPFCHGGNIPDPEFGKQKSCASFVKPMHNFPAHSAPLGMRFIKSTPGLKGDVLVAEHGSWNRSTPIGYQVTRLKLKDGRVAEAAPFLRGFLKNGNAWGRPVDLLELTDGTVLVSDDFTGTVYRIKLQKR